MNEMDTSRFVFHQFDVTYIITPCCTCISYIHTNMCLVMKYAELERVGAQEEKNAERDAASPKKTEHVHTIQ